jgi:hypothetical protein
MRKLSKLPGRVRSFSGHKTFRHAAWFKTTQAGSIEDAVTDLIRD